MHPNLLSLMLFCFVTSCTPGPNNILASYSSFNFGIKKTLPHMLGVALGYTSMITVLDVGLIFPFKKYPIIQDVLKVLGSNCFTSRPKSLMQSFIIVKLSA